jgi:hypothetical protein
MRWTRSVIVFAQNVENKPHTTVVYLVRRSVAHNAVQNCSGKALITTSFFYKKRTGR